MAISPMVIAVLAFIFLGESLKPLEVAGIVLISIGTYSLELKKGEGVLYPFSVLAGSKHHRYLLAALALISISSVIDKALLTNFKLPPITFLVFQNFFFFVIFFVIALITGRGKSFAVNKNVLILIVIIAVLTVLYRWSQIEATKIAPVGLVISVKRLSVLFASIAGAQLFKEGDYVRRAIATVLIVGGAMMIFRD
jgi:drug/metabolite transporter (DMT)-like permease